MRMEYSFDMAKIEKILARIIPPLTDLIMDGLKGNPELKVEEPSLPIPTPSITPISFEREVPSPSYPGQTKEDYCLECLERHYLKALGLLEEAERFSLSKGEITPEARQRIELALKEAVTAEEDLGTMVRDKELARMLDEIKVKYRDWRKWLWSERLLSTQKDIGKLREAIDGMRRLVELTRKAMEYYHSKYGKCNYCEALAKELSEKFGVEESEALEAIYGMASENKERIRESAEKLKRMGAFEYTMKRVKEMLMELEGGKK